MPSETRVERPEEQNKSPAGRPVSAAAAVAARRWRQRGGCVLGSVLVLAVLAGCGVSVPASGGGDANPPLPGFNLADSDPRALAVADATMAAMGGRKAWDQTRYLTWRFFGRHLHVWDKLTGDIRVEWGTAATPDHAIVLMNLHTRRGRAWLGDAELTEATALAEQLKRGYEVWINDSYWLVMPYKLKDTGVTLRYQGTAALESEGGSGGGRLADVLELTFDAVGVTPANKYHIYVARDTHLVEQWAYYARASDPDPRFVGPWRNWQQFGRIKLSADHGEGRRHSDVAALDDLPRKVFTNP